MINIVAPTWAEIGVFLTPLIKFALILLIGHFAAGYLIHFVTRLFSNSKLDPSLIRYCIKTLNVILHVVVIIAGLEAIGVSTTAAIAAVCVTVIAVAIALKDSLGNVAGGILLLFNPRFYTGDRIAACGESGTVTSVALLHTTLLTDDNRQISIPNGLLVNGNIINYSREEHRRVDIVFSIPCDADPEAAKQIAAETISRHPMALTKPEAPFVRIQSFDENAIRIATRTWCKAADEQALYFDLTEQVQQAFSAHGIAIPCSRLEVRIRDNHPETGEPKDR